MRTDRVQAWTVCTMLLLSGAGASAAPSSPVSPTPSSLDGQPSFEANAPAASDPSAPGAAVKRGSKPSDRSTEPVDEVLPESDLSSIAPLIDGPAPPAPPEVMARDARGRVTLRAIRLTHGLEIDGRLDEHVYESVRSIDQFVQVLPDIGKPATQKTEAWIFFDEANIYVAARCWDALPESQWVANDMRRDSQRIITNNDSFGATFDTFYDRRNGLRFYTNPLGAFNDTQVTNEGTINRDWNTVWALRTGRFEGGWTVEMQIPFKSLRYRPGRSQVWGVQLRRVMRNRNEFAFVTPLPATSAGTAWNRVSMAATLVGVEAPPPGKRIEIKPYAIAGMSTDRIAVPSVTNEVTGDVGLDVKYGITQNLTSDFTYNTDFAQVEVDEQQVNMTRFNLFFPEKREFFLEGYGIFEFGRGSSTGTRGNTNNVPDLFFSRTIGLSKGRAVPIVGGARLTGKVGHLGIGALNIQTGDDSASGAQATNFTAVRLKQDLLRRSSVGMIFTGRSRSALVSGDSNQAYGVDAAFSFYENVNFNGFYARTETAGLTGRNESYEGRFDYNADRYGLEVDHLVIGDAFKPEAGFVRRDDMRRTFVSSRFSPRPRSIRSVRRFSWEGSLEYIENTAGQLETRQQLFAFETEFQNSDRINIDVSRTYEFLVEPFRLLNRVTIPTGGYQFGAVKASYAMGQQRRFAGTFTFERGSFYDGEQKTVGFSQGRLEITRQLSLEPKASITWIDLPYGTFATQLYQARVDYTFSPRMFLSGLMQYNSTSNTTSTNMRVRWEYSPGSELFVVYTEERDRRELPGAQYSGLMNRALVVKLNRLLRF